MTTDTSRSTQRFRSSQILVISARLVITIPYDLCVDLAYPSPDLTDDVVRLRKWRLTDFECVRLAATDPNIPLFTSVPAEFTEEGGVSFIERQWSRLKNGEGLALAVALQDSDLAIGSITLTRTSEIRFGLRNRLLAYSRRARKTSSGSCGDLDVRLGIDAWIH